MPSLHDGKQKEGTVLFVDDEQSSLDLVKRVLTALRAPWRMLFAATAQEALAILGREDVHVVVADLRMPGIDGAQLLELVGDRSPRSVRIILSGQVDRNKALSDVVAAHQYVPKPWRVEQLHQAVSRALRARMRLRDGELLSVVSGMRKLPSEPSLYLQLLREMENEDVPLRRVGDIIAQDMALTAKVLQFVNSALFALPRAVSTPQQAAAMLGVHTLKSLVLYVQVFCNQDDSPRNAMIEELRRHALRVARIARHIALTEQATPEEAEESFVAGILHDVGKLALLSKPSYSERVEAMASQLQLTLLDAERVELGATHADIGAYLLELWGIPERIVDLVAYHHEPSVRQGPRLRSLAAVHLANYVCGHSLSSNPPSLPPEVDLAYLGIEAEALPAVVAMHRAELEKLDSNY